MRSLRTITRLAGFLYLNIKPHDIPAAAATTTTIIIIIIIIDIFKVA